MAADQLKVTVSSVAHVPMLAMGGQTFVNVTRVGIMVGPFGPFYKDFPAGEDTVANINAWKAQKQMEVAAINS